MTLFSVFTDFLMICSYFKFFWGFGWNGPTKLQDDQVKHRVQDLKPWYRWLT